MTPLFIAMLMTPLVSGTHITLPHLGQIPAPRLEIQRPDFVSPLPQLVSADDASRSADVTPAALPYVAPSERWASFITSAKKIAEIYNYPANVVIAQAALESGHGTSEYAVLRNNYIGIGAFDSNPDDAFWFENQEQCLIEYMRTIRRNFPDAWDSRDNPEKLLRLLKDNSRGNYYASDPDYIAKVMSQPEWEGVK